MRLPGTWTSRSMRYSVECSGPPALERVGRSPSTSASAPTGSLSAPLLANRIAVAPYPQEPVHHSRFGGTGGRCGATLEEHAGRPRRERPPVEESPDTEGHGGRRKPTRGNPRESATETYRRWRGRTCAPHRQG